MDEASKKTGELVWDEYQVWLRGQGRRHAARVSAQLAAVDREALDEIAQAAVDETDSSAVRGTLSDFDRTEIRASVFDRRLREQGYIVPTRWEAFKERVGERVEAWSSWLAPPAPPPGPSPVLEGSPQSDPDPPRETTWPILCHAGAVSPGDTIEPAVGRWFTVVELGEAQEPPEDHAGIRPYGTRCEPEGRWQTALCRNASLPEIAIAQKAQREQAGEELHREVSGPGPAEHAGGVFLSKAEAEEYGKNLATSQDSHIDCVSDANGETNESAVTARPHVPSSDVARDERVVAQVRQLQDPQQRAHAERLLQTIQREDAARRRSKKMVLEVEMDR